MSWKTKIESLDNKKHVAEATWLTNEIFYSIYASIWKSRHKKWHSATGFKMQRWQGFGMLCLLELHDIIFLWSGCRVLRERRREGGCPGPPRNRGLLQGNDEKVFFCGAKKYIVKIRRIRFECRPYGFELISTKCDHPSTFSIFSAKGVKFHQNYQIKLLNGRFCCIFFCAVRSVISYAVVWWQPWKGGCLVLLGENGIRVFLFFEMDDRQEGKGIKSVSKLQEYIA